MASATETEKDQKSPTMVEDFEARATARVKELNIDIAPKVAELEELQSALDAIHSKDGQGEPAEVPAPSRPRQRRRRKGGTRADQFVKIVSENPGITVSEIAKKMRLNKPNYLYRVADEMVKDGRLKKEDKGYVVKA